MNVKVFLFAAFITLSTTGSSCVNDGILVVVNLSPIVGRYHIAPGNDTTFSGFVRVKLDSLISTDYKNRIKQARIYDLKISVEGNYGGMLRGRSTIQIGSDPAIDLLRYPQVGSTRWSNFYKPQSLLGKSADLVPQTVGVDVLLRALTMKPAPEIVLSSNGTLSVAPVPENLYVVIEVYVQADAEVN